MRQHATRGAIALTRALALALALVLSAGLACASARAADVKVDNAWARATPPGQQVGGAFMNLTADADASLVGARSPASRSVELHAMNMADGVMSMRQMDRIDLPQGKTVSLKPGGLHLMFIDLKAPLRADAKIPLTLIWSDRAGKRSEKTITVPVRGLDDRTGKH